MFHLLQMDALGEDKTTAGERLNKLATARTGALPPTSGSEASLTELGQKTSAPPVKQPRARQGLNFDSPYLMGGAGEYNGDIS